MPAAHLVNFVVSCTYNYPTSVICAWHLPKGKYIEPSEVMKMIVPNIKQPGS